MVEWLAACIVMTIISPENRQITMMKAITNHVYPSATPTLDGNGSMAIAMDDFLYVDMSQYKDDVIVKMLRLKTAFKRDA